MALFVDRYRDQIAQLVSAKECNRAGKEAFQEFRSVCQRKCAEAGIRSASLIDPENANDLLQGIHTEIEAKLEALVAGYSSARWLFMLRRLPESVFGGQLLSTIAYDSALAEVLSARSALVEEIRKDASSFYYHNDGSSVRRLLRFCEGVRTLSQVHVLARWCGKGASLRIGKDWLPTAERTDELCKAVQIYDGRCVQERSAWSAAGTVFSEQERAASDCIVVAERTLLQPFPVPENNIIYGTACPRLISLTDIRKLTQEAMRVAHTPWPSEAALAIWIARAVWFYFVQRHRTLPIINQIFNTGYLLISKEVAEQWIAAVAADCNQVIRDTVGHSLEIATLEDLVSLVQKDQGTAWPLWPRDLIRTLPGMICVDLCAASTAIRDSLEYTEETGAIANVRGDHFEVAVQKMIDGTRWRPEGEPRKLIGLRLKTKSGKDEKTDIDAVGHRNSTLLLVSCKSKLKSRQYDLGKYSVVRNAASAMATARTKWESVLGAIRSSPGEFNGEFTPYSKIIGVVCTSSVFYAPIAVMTVNSPEEVPIRGLNELRQWLEAEQPS